MPALSPQDTHHRKSFLVSFVFAFRSFVLARLTQSHACPPSSPSVWLLVVICTPRSVVYRRSLGEGSWLFAHQSLHGAVQHISVVASELGVGTLEGRVSGGLGLLDTVLRRNCQHHHQCLFLRKSIMDRFARSSGRVAGLRSRRIGNEAAGFERTRYGEPSWTGCAETSSWTLFARFVSLSQSSHRIFIVGAYVRTGHCD